MGGWPINTQRCFLNNGVLNSSAVCFLRAVASPLKGQSSLCANKIKGSNLSNSVDLGVKKEFFHSDTSISQSTFQEASYNMPCWKILRQEEHGIPDKCIPDYAWKVLRKLQEKGHEVYLVGGSVRDMLLKQIPKDFDVITTAELQQVKRGFPHAFIVGKRFPVCHVHIGGKIVEVSSFSTVAKIPGKQKVGLSLIKANHEDSKKFSDTHHARWENCLRRDFTINGLLYDPFRKTIYDYIGGVEDLHRKKVRTVIPANESFKEDSARILRALRIAARLGFKFSRETAQAIQKHSTSLNDLHQERLRMEINYLMSYGASEPSIRLLWRFGLLEILFPPQASYLASQGFKRQDKGSNMLMMLLANLDKLLSPAKPCHCSLWINLLALHLALFNNPQSPVVVLALALTVNGKDLTHAVRKAMRLHKKYCDLVGDFPELVKDSEKMTRGNIKRKVFQLCEKAINALHLMSSTEFVSNAMSRHPEAPSSNVVLLTKQLLGRCEDMFFQVFETSDTTDDQENQDDNRKVVRQAKKDHKRSINRLALVEGSLDEVSFVFGHIVISTVYPNAGRKQESS